MSYKEKPAVETLETRTLFAAPLVITHGGTYSGTWESFDRSVPAVVVKTSEPVIIENSVVRGRGDLIVSGVDHTNITVRNTSGFGLNPGVYGKAPGRFFEAEVFDNVVLENNHLENTGGIKLLNYAGDFSSNETVRIVRNQAHNIDGRKSDGAGGWLDFNERTRLSDGTSEKGYVYAQFVQFDKVRHLGGIEIGWNKVVNDPGQSRVEDVISIYKSSGTPASPIAIHDNYIQGAYTIKPGLSDYSDGTYSYDWGFSGGGIMLGDGVGATAADDSSFVNAFNNTVVSTTNYGIALSAGHDLLAYKNRIVSAGTLADGTAITQQNVGLYVWDSYHAGSSHFFNNSARDNVIGWNKDGGRNDWWGPDSGAFVNNTHMAGPITLATEAAELARWQGGQSDNDVPPAATGGIAGTIFEDANGDGLRDAGDDVATGFGVYLDLDNDGAYTDGEPQTKSSSTGRYRFDDLAPGEYTVRLMPTGGWRGSKGSFATLVVVADQITTRYFGVTTTTLVAGTVYLDRNADGGRDGGEAGMAGWTVYADTNQNGQLDEGELTAVTNVNGRYALVGLAPGSYYQVRVAQQSGYRRTSPGAGYRPVNLSVGDYIDGRNFGQKRLKSAAA